MLGWFSIFMDNRVIHTKQQADELKEQHITRHCQYINKIFDILMENNVYVKPEKCAFEQEEIKYLNVIVRKGKLHTDLKKLHAVLTSLLDLLPPPSPLVPYPSLLSEQGIHSLAFHPLFLWEPSSSLPYPAFVHPLSSHRCLDNIDPLVAGFATPPHLTLHPQTPPQGAVPCPTLPSLCAPPLPSSSPG